LRDLVNVIAKRPAPTHFHLVKGHSGNKSNDAVDGLAKERADVEPHESTYSCPQHRNIDLPSSSPLADVYKVFTTLPSMALPTSKTNTALPMIETDVSNAHRGHVKVQLLQCKNLQSLIDCKNDLHF
jgi:hypothetical protein